ncbi:MAG: terminase [Armatimonadota bacterium]
MLGIELLPWERWFLIHALELRSDGGFRFRTIVLLVARQNGKSTVLQVLSLWFLYVAAVRTIIGTAQNLDVAEEQWEAAVEMAQEVDELASEIAHVSRVNGRKFLKLESGERYRVAAASRRGGRGLTGDLILLDELREHQSWDAWAAVTKTTMARAFALIVCASNAGDASSLVLRHLRMQAHRALGDPDGIIEASQTFVSDPDVEELDDELQVDDEDLGLFEWSAPPGCGIFDRDGWCQANPALGHTISERAIASAARTDPEWVFRVEVLCQWQEGSSEGPFPPGSWEATCDPDSRVSPDSRIVWCVDVSWDRSTAYIGVAGWRDDGRPHVEIAEAGAGLDWVVDWLTDPRHPDREQLPVAVQAKRAPATSLIEQLREAGLDVLEWDGVEGTGELYDRVRASVEDEIDTPELRHLKQPLLDQPAATAATRPVGDAWAWDRRKSPVDAAPLVAVTGALWGLLLRDEDEPSVYEHRGLASL